MFESRRNHSACLVFEHNVWVKRKLSGRKMSHINEETQRILRSRQDWREVSFSNGKAGLEKIAWSGSTPCFKRRV